MRVHRGPYPRPIRRKGEALRWGCGMRMHAYADAQASVRITTKKRVYPFYSLLHTLPLRIAVGRVLGFSESSLFSSMLPERSVWQNILEKDAAKAKS